jgi:DNA polymerase III subunit epsilon
MKSANLRFSEGTFAVVDTETTGTSPGYNRIIEIGIVRVEAGKVVETFQSLVNPECHIEPIIESITGISAAELSQAPSFSDVAGRVSEILRGAVFVAHNVRFDYGFLKNEFKRLNKRFSAQCLCTVTLSRKLYPGNTHHDLSSLIERFGLVCEHRHRALPDAIAAYDFMRSVQTREGEDRLNWGIQAAMEGSVPRQLDREIIRSLPDTPGVYLFYGPKNELLYVGKSKNIRRRVVSHFSLSPASGKELSICGQTHAVEARTTAGELGALLLESRLIKDLQPIHNRVARLKRKLVVLRKRETREGYASCDLQNVEVINPWEVGGLLTVFKNRTQARETLVTMAREYDLCHKLLGLEKTSSCCFQYHLHRCHGACVGSEEPEAYNARFEAAFAERKLHAWPFPSGILIEEKGDDEKEGEAFLVDQWCLVSSVRFTDDGFRDILPGVNTFDYDSYKILLSYLRNRKNRKTVRRLTKPQYESLLSELGTQQAAG